MEQASLFRPLLALAVLALAVARLARGMEPVPVLLLGQPPPAEAETGLDPAFAGLMTPDDVARGAWALARGQGPGLQPDQREALQEAALAGLAARRRTDALRAAVRAARMRLDDDGLALAQALVAAGWSP